MKCFSNINRIANCWNRFGIEYIIWDVFMYFCFLSLFLMQPTTVSFWTPKLATKKKIRPTKYPRQNVLDPWNIHKEKFWAHEIPRKKKFKPTKYLRRSLLMKPIFTWWGGLSNQESLPSASTKRVYWSDASTIDQNKQIFSMLMPRTWFKVEEFGLE